MMSQKSKQKLWVKLIPIFIIIGGFGLVLTFKKVWNVEFGKYSENEFLFTFLGILLGFSLTVFQFIVALAEKVKDNADTTLKDDSTRKKRLELQIRDLYHEIRQDIMFVFFSLVGVAILYFCQQINIPAFNIGSMHIQLPISKDELFDCLRLSVFLLNMYAIYDIIICSFILADPTALMKRASTNDKSS